MLVLLAGAAFGDAWGRCRICFCACPRSRFCGPVRESGRGEQKGKGKERKRAGARRRAQLLRWSCSIGYRNFRHRLARQLNGIQGYKIDGIEEK